jgi:hypothetical protein
VTTLHGAVSARVLLIGLVALAAASAQAQVIGGYVPIAVNQRTDGGTGRRRVIQ